MLTLTAGALQALDQLSAERRDLEKAYRWEWDNDDVIKGRAQGLAYDPDQPFREGLQRCEQRGVRVKLLAGGSCLWSGSLQGSAEAKGDCLMLLWVLLALSLPWGGLWASIPSPAHLSGLAEVRVPCKDAAQSLVAFSKVQKVVGVDLIM